MAGREIVSSAPSGALMLFSDDQRKAFEEIADKARDLKGQLLERPPQTADEAGKVHEVIAVGKTLLKRLDVARLAHTKPMREEVETINETYNATIQELQRMVKAGERQYLAYQDAEEKRVAREREMARQEEAAAADREAAALLKLQNAESPAERAEAHREAAAAANEQAVVQAITPQHAPTTANTAHGSSHRRYVQRIEVTDAASVPREYCSPDKAKIEAGIKLGAVIPGVTVYEDPILATRGR